MPGLPLDFLTSGDQSCGHSPNHLLLGCASRLKMKVYVASKIKALFYRCIDSGLQNDFCRMPFCAANCQWLFAICSVSSELHRLLRDQFLHPFYKLRHRYSSFRLLLAADAHVHRLGFSFFFADYK